MNSKLLLLLTLALTGAVHAQLPDRISGIFPEGTVYHQNISYANDTLKKHLLDIYLPGKKSGQSYPVIIWIHGGAWMVNDKYADMSYMKTTLRSFVEKGFAVASIDYRHSTTAIFPAQIQDCIQGVQFLHDNSGRYKLDRKRFILMGFSAGGHLGSLLGLSLNNDAISFYPSGKKPDFAIKGVLDFYGPSNFLLFYSDALPGKDESPIGKLLGASPLERPDLSAIASPVTYVDRDDPPFFIVHGEKDDAVAPTQSYLLKSYLDISKVKNDLVIVKGAPHFGEMFDNADVRDRLFTFLDDLLK